MADPERVEQLYADWLSAIEQGFPVQPEALCGDQPELIEPLRQRIEASSIVPALDEAASDYVSTTPELPADRRPSPPTSERFIGEQFHAQGNLGMVLLAEDRELHRSVALKRIRPDRDGPAPRSRFLHEAEITGRLEHPGIVPVYSLGQDRDGRPYYAMRFISGQSLQERIDAFHAGNGAHAPRTVVFRELLDQFADVCQALAYAHARGVIHGDVKPANVMLGRFGETLIVDWGLARAIGQGDDPIIPLGGSAVPPGSGTPAFMSPQQASGERASPADDIFSLGAMLYVVLTGHRPFEGASTVEIVERALRGDITPARRWQKGVPAALEAIARKAMSPNPAERYASAAELADDVSRWLADEPILARCEPLGERLARLTRRYRGVVLSSAIAAVLLAVGGVTAAALIEHQRREAVHERQVAITAREDVERQSHRLRESLYVGEVSLAQRSWESGELVRMQELLQRQMPQAGQTDLRDFPWFYLQRQLQRTKAARVLRGPSQAAVQAIALGPAADQAVVAHADGQLICWDLRQGQPLRSGTWGRPTHDAAPRLTLTSDGRWIVIGDPTGWVRLFDTITLRETQAFRAHAGRLLGLDLPANTPLIATVGLAEGHATELPEVMIWSLPEGRQLHRIVPPWIAGTTTAEIAFDLEGHSLVVASVSGELAVIDPDRGVVRNATSLLGNDGAGFTALTVGPAGRMFVTGSRNGRVTLWHLPTLASMISIPIGGWPIRHVSFVDDRRRVIVVDDTGVIRIIDGRGYPFNQIRWDGPPATCARMLPQGQSLLSGRADGSLVLHDAPHHENLGDSALNLIANVQDLAITPDGQSMVVVAADDHERQRAFGGLSNSHSESQLLVAHLHDRQEGQTIWATLPNLRAVAVAPPPPGETASQQVVVAGEYVHIPTPVGALPRVLSLSDGQQIKTIGRVGDSYKHLVFSPDGRQLAMGTGRIGPDEAGAYEPGHVQLWDVAEGRLIWDRIAHPDRIIDMSFTSDGRRLASAARIGPVQVWDTRTGERLQTLTTDYVATALAYSPDNRWLVTAGGGYQQSSGPLLPRGGPLVRPPGNINGQITIWDAATATTQRTLSGHSGHVMSVAFSPDGRTLASGGLDGLTCLWDVAAGKKRWELPGTPGQAVARVAFTNSGEQVIVSGGVLGSSSSVRIWDVAQGQALPFDQAGLPDDLTVAFPLPGRSDLLLVSANGLLQRRSLVGAIEADLQSPTLSNQRLLSVAVSRDSQRYFTGNEQGTIQVWDARSGRPLATWPVAKEAIVTLAISQDNRFLAAGTGHPDLGSSAIRPKRPGEVTILDAATGAVHRTLPEQPAGIAWVGFAPRSATLYWISQTGAQPGKVAEIHRHDLDTGEDHHVACPSLQPTTGAVHPEEDFLLVGGAGQQSATPAGRVLALRLPDLSTALEWTAHGGNGRLDALAISPDGRTLATGGGDLSIRVWRMAGVRPEEILTLNGHASPPTVAAFGPKGQTLVTGDSGGRIWVWRATTDLGP